MKPLILPVFGYQNGQHLLQSFGWKKEGCERK